MGEHNQGACTCVGRGQLCFVLFMDFNDIYRNSMFHEFQAAKIHDITTMSGCSVNESFSYSRKEMICILNTILSRYKQFIKLCLLGEKLKWNENEMKNKNQGGHFDNTWEQLPRTFKVEICPWVVMAPHVSSVFAHTAVKKTKAILCQWWS